ncbi:MAG: glutamine amidotransferase [Alicyclobacillus sp.]|nr:glutamine amidotransferase [Alicyclobacillus sp.]
MAQPLHIAHLYPDLLNLYADRGNIRTLRMRCLWRGIEVTVSEVPAGSRPDFARYHLVLLGGGSDREQAIVGETLAKWKGELRAAIEAGMPLLAICGGYQLLGSYYQLPDGTKVPGLDLLDLVTVAGSPRLIGNVAVESDLCGTIVGFENHGGRTTHNHEPLGKVVRGCGNNGKDGYEGVQYKHVIGTYIHGPLLPKNPRLADLVLARARAYQGVDHPLEPLDDTLEDAARKAFLTRRVQL